MIFVENKKWGRILVPAVGLGEKYWVGVKNIQGCLQGMFYILEVFLPKTLQDSACCLITISSILKAAVWRVRVRVQEKDPPL